MGNPLSHQIEQSADLSQAAFASARLDAWHRLGTVVDHNMSSTEALELAHLNNWNVRKRPMYYQPVDGGEFVVDPKSFMVVRDNPFKPDQVDAFRQVGAQYQPVANETSAELLDALHDNSGAFIETAGSLMGGKQVFICMKMPETMTIGGKDTVEPYITVTNRHDGQGSFQFISSMVRPECANTLAAMFRNTMGSFKARHTANSTKAITEQVRNALGMSYKFMGEFQEAADKMIDTEFTDNQFKRLTESLYPVAKGATDLVAARVKDDRQTLVNLWKESPTMETVRGTRWGAYQSVTEFLDHFATYKGKSGEKGEEYRALQSVQQNSPSLKLKSKAFQLLSV
jgi:phage/plasmid-like protein (TIGR03299 family)